MKKEKEIPQVHCLRDATPSPSFSVVVRLVVALVIVYFMISAWDDFLDECIRKAFHIEKDTLAGRLMRAIVASLIAVAILMLVRIDIDDLMGAFVHEQDE